MMRVALAVALIGCSAPDALVADAWTAPDAGSDVGSDAGTDAGSDGGSDAGTDAGPSGLTWIESARVDGCYGEPVLTSNGDGWALWWPDCPFAPHLLELDEAGHVGASLALPAPPAGAIASAIMPTSVVFAHDTYALGGNAYPPTETTLFAPFIATLDRTGASPGWIAVTDASSANLEGWDETPGWWSTEGSTLVLRDASLREVSRSMLAMDGGELARGPHDALVWEQSRLARIAPDGAVTPLALTTVTPYDAVAWNDGFLVTAWSADHMGLDLVIVDAPGSADVRAHMPGPRGPLPSIAAMPERDRAAICWVEQQSGDAFVYSVQLMDVAAGERIGAPTVVHVDGAWVGGPSCAWGGTHLLYAWSTTLGTVVASYVLTP